MGTPPRKPRRPVAPALADEADFLRLEGVRVHNLKGIDVAIPRNRLTVVSGVSGSGKSSLAFDTLYAEGRRRYVECLSTYLQQYLERMPRPDVDRVGSLPPALALQRAVPATQARSTVGSITEIHDHLRLLFARIGETRCANCGRPVRVESPGDVADAAIARGGRATVTFDADPPSKAGWARFVARQVAAGFQRLWRDGAAARLEEAPYAAGPVEIVADRVALEPARRGRIVEAVELAYRFGHDRARVRFDDGAARRFSRRLHCAECDLEAPVPDPNLFSPNSPLGACPDCQGFGRAIRPSMAKVIPDDGLSLAEGAVDPWNKPSYKEAYDDLHRAGKKVGLDWDTAYRDLPAAQRRLVEEGGHGFYGIRGFFEWLERRTYKVHVRVFLARYREYLPCATCGGAKLRPEALAVRIRDRHVAELAAVPVGELRRWFAALDLTGAERDIAAPILREVEGRLGVLDDVGLDYLTLERATRTLSGGEAQRIQVARSLGSGLVDTLYVLDEPSIGLHPRDVERLIGVIRRLTDRGNTVVVVEHDARVLREADWLVDLGPGAGERGGEVLYQGPVEGVLDVPASATGAYLSGTARVEREPSARVPGEHGFLVLEGATVHNLRDVTARFPRNALTVVTGVSGSGKSSLIHDTLHGALARATGGENRETLGPYRALSGAEGIVAVHLVDQSPIGRTPRSNPVTYVKAFDGIRKKLAATREARARGLAPGYFSFNVPGGRCDACEGSGAQVVEMHFLADMVLPCESCGGSRFGPGALDVRYRGRNVAEILDLTVTEAVRLFEDAPDVVAPLRVLAEIGLGYLRLGQPAPTLSGGEAQRLKLAAHLGTRRRQDPMVFLLDEPTTGLHLSDVAVLVRLLDRLVGAGHTVIVVEHHLELIRAADWMVDLGPGSGERGGRVVFEGPPAEAARSDTETGRYLARAL